ncbi:MAG: carboxypeptidase regulatory-like domain-containing protein [Planctomycetes bacterium]|nr:carboxypeptidase regulatory-like domain-containing protein [Planctomycetota bacterium]
MKLGLSIAAAAMLGIALIVGLLLRPASAPSAGASPSLASPTLEAATAPEPASRAPIEGVVRAAVDALASTVETAPGRVVAVRGLCLAAEDRLPLAGCVVGAGGPLLQVRTAHELDGPSLLSDERGAFRLEVAASFQPRELWIEGEGRCRERIELRALDEWARAVDSDPAREIDLGEILLVRGREVRGVLREPDGKPIARAELFARIPVREHLEFAVVTAAPEVTLFARTDAQGRFAFRPHAPAGSYEYELVQPASHELLSPQGFALEGDGHEALELVVTAAPLPRITGRLRIAGLAELPPRWSEGLVIVGTSRLRQPHAPTLDAAGHFVFEARRGERDPLQIEITGGGFAPLRLPQAIPWGTSDVEIELVTTGSLHLAVVDAQSGAPIERFAAFCVSRDPQVPKPELEWPEPARHEGGTLMLGGVPAVLARCMCGPIKPEPSVRRRSTSRRSRTIRRASAWHSSVERRASSS